MKKDYKAVKNVVSETMSSPFGGVEGAFWNNYLQWLYNAYEEFRKTRHVYKRSYYFYNKIYWDRRFREEISKVEKMAELENLMEKEGIGENGELRVENDKLKIRGSIGQH